MKPLRGRVLVEPIHFEDSYPGRVILPPKFRRPFPSSGVVKAVGKLKEDIKVGDIVIFAPSHIKAVEGKLYQSFRDNQFIVHEDVCYAVLRGWNEEDSD